MVKSMIFMEMSWTTHGHFIRTCHDHSWTYMGVSYNGGTLKWMVVKENPIEIDDN